MISTVLLYWRLKEITKGPFSELENPLLRLGRFGAPLIG